MAPTANNVLQFYFGTSTQFASATKNADALYFLTDTKQVYLGSDLYTGSTELVTEFPASPSQGILYVNTTTKEAKMWNGTAWVVVRPEIVSEIVESGASATPDTAIPNVGAIKDFVTEQIGASYEIRKQTTADSGFAATYQLFKGDTAVGDKVQILKDQVVSGGETKIATQADVTAEIYPGVQVGDPYIELTIANNDGTKLYIPVKSLVEYPTVDDTNSVDLSVDANHKITADVKISATTGNILSVENDGLLAEHYVGSVADTNSVDLDVTGKELTANVKVSAETGNKVTIANDGLFVAADYIGSIDDTDSVDLTVDANAKLTADVKVSDNTGNIISTVSTAGHQGLFAEHYIASVTDTNSADLTVSGKALSVDVKRSATAGNIITENADGLYAAVTWNAIA